MSREPEQPKTIVTQRSTKSATHAVLTITSGADTGRVVSVTHEPVTLGRSSECTIPFGDQSLSRVHARIQRLEDVVVLQDLGSTNGSFVNEVRVDFAEELTSGDRIRLGDSTALRYFLVDADEERAMRESFALSRRDTFAARLRELPEDEATLREELVAAGEFQQRALAKPPKIDDMAVDLLYLPLDLVGGDLYHVSRLPDGGARVFVADATGHGIRASLSMMLMLSEYEVARSAAEPGAVLRELNERFATTHTHWAVRFTALCADLDTNRGELRVASAAHPAAWLLRDGQAEELESAGSFVGLVPGLDFPTTTTKLERGDVFVAFTDGITDAFDPSGASFGEARVLEAVRSAPAGQWASHAERALTAFRRGRKLDDDVTLVALGWHKA